MATRPPTQALPRKDAVAFPEPQEAVATGAETGASPGRGGVVARIRLRLDAIGWLATLFAQPSQPRPLAMPLADGRGGSVGG